jgi:hypothetical protein
MRGAILAAGPWVGEFGHELFNWQAHLRAMSREWGRVVVASRPGHEALYADFADFIPFDSDACNCSGRANSCPCDISGLFDDIPYLSHMPSCRLVNTPEYVRYGTSGPRRFDVVIHARDISPVRMSPEERKSKGGRNWTMAGWEHLAVKLEARRIAAACIGHPEASLALPGCEDLRGLPLSQLADVLACSGCIVGPSSGPMHFATLCGCRQVVWGEKWLEKRYTVDWNPFGTPVSFVACGPNWKPSKAGVCDTLFRTLEQT